MLILSLLFPFLLREEILDSTAENTKEIDLYS